MRADPAGKQHDPDGDDAEVPVERILPEETPRRSRRRRTAAGDPPSAWYDRVGLTVRDRRGPREQIAQAGVESLSDRELITAVLGTGCTGTPVSDVAEALLRDGSLEALSRAGLRELRHRRGLGAARACQILAAFEIGRRAFGRTAVFDRPVRTPQDLLPLVQHYSAARKEHFVIVLLNTRHVPIAVELISVGSLAASIVHPREVFRAAILASAASMILVHNHPSGDSAPSEDDVEITQRLCRVGELTGIEILDHVVLGSGNPFSFREAGLM